MNISHWTKIENVETVWGSRAYHLESIGNCEQVTNVLNSYVEMCGIEVVLAQTNNLEDWKMIELINWADQLHNWAE